MAFSLDLILLAVTTIVFVNGEWSKNQEDVMFCRIFPQHLFNYLSVFAAVTLKYISCTRGNWRSFICFGFVAPKIVNIKHFLTVVGSSKAFRIPQKFVMNGKSVSVCLLADLHVWFWWGHFCVRKRVYSDFYRCINKSDKQFFLGRFLSRQSVTCGCVGKERIEKWKSQLRQNYDFILGKTF